MLHCAMHDISNNVTGKIPVFLLSNTFCNIFLAADVCYRIICGRLDSYISSCKENLHLHAN